MVAVVPRGVRRSIGLSERDQSDGVELDDAARLSELMGVMMP